MLWRRLGVNVERERQRYSFPLDRAGWRAIKRKPGFSFALQPSLVGTGEKAGHNPFPLKSLPESVRLSFSFLGQEISFVCVYTHIRASIIYTIKCTLARKKIIFYFCFSISSPLAHLLTIILAHNLSHFFCIFFQLFVQKGLDN